MWKAAMPRPMAYHRYLRARSVSGCTSSLNVSRVSSSGRSVVLMAVSKRVLGKHRGAVPVRQQCLTSLRRNQLVGNGQADFTVVLDGALMERHALYRMSSGLVWPCPSPRWRAEATLRSLVMS